MSLMPLTDSMFLLAEKRENPMHVGGLQLFELPEGVDPEYVGEMYRGLIASTAVQPRFRLRPRRPLTNLGQWAWGLDEDIDLEYHARLSALPRPCRVRELLELTSRLHGSLLDRRRPLWEFHLIEGLTGNRFATYMKIHHALMDGVSALRLLGETLSADPEARDVPPPWAVRPRRTSKEHGTMEAGDPLAASIRAAQAVVGTTQAAVRVAGQVVGVGPAVVGMVSQALREQAAPLPLQAPRSMLNVPITGARRFAAQSWPLERVKPVRAALGGTVNDIVLTMCAGALRRYLLELDGLPDRPLVAMVPVSLRTAGDAQHPAGGNAVGTLLCNLGTHLADPVQRYEQIRTSMLRGKRMLTGLTPLQITVLSAIVMAPLVATPLPGVIRFTPPAFNLVISNVPGPRRPLYWNGARLQGVYPLSIPIDGQALNITVTSYVDSLEFGLTGCRRSVPHLQRLLGHLETSLAELEKAVT